MTEASSRLRGRLPATLRNVLPQGRALPEAAWWSRHRGLLVLLWLHVAAIPIFAIVKGFSPLHAVLETAVVALPAALASPAALSRRLRTLAASFGLLTSSAVLVHLSGGLIEMHFHFFVMVAAVALYQDWIPFLAAIAYVFVHHGLMGALDPTSVYNHPAALRDPWRWAGVHALFISGTSAACLVTWRLNEHFLDTQRRTEDRLREETRVVETLNAVGRTLAAELDLQRVVQTVTDAATKLTNAAFGAFFYNVVNQSGEAFMLYSLSGAPAEAFAHMPMPRNTEIFRPTFSGEAVVRLDDVTADPRFGKSAPYHGLPPGHLPVCSYLAVPVRSRTGDVLGGLFFGHPEPGRFGEVDERLVVGIAAQAAIAIDNARLYESERQSRVASEEARSDLSLLADASNVLTSSLEMDSILADLTRLVVPRLGDECSVDLVRDDGSLARAATAQAGRLAGSPSSAPDPDDPAHPVVQAIRSREASVLDNVPHRPGVTGGKTVVVPLLRRNEAIGALSVATAEDDGRLDERGIHLVEELARRIALAVENARLYSRQRTVAETLQHSLLPKTLPNIPGITAAARYLPGGPGVEIGGDWYDVVQVAGGEIALAMGDVVGRGEHAASLMGQLRSALRAYSFAGSEPTQIVEQLNDLLIDLGPENMATMAYVLLEPDTGTLRVISAGHPPPLVVAADGAATFLEGAPGVPLGAMSHAVYVETVTSLVPGATVILYTDGLVEDRKTPLDTGCDRLRRAATSGPADLERLCDHILAEALRGRDSQDDIALLVVRLEPLTERLSLRLPRTLSSLSPLRSALRRWLAAAGASDDELFEILVAVGEASSNAIRHAGGSSSSSFEIEAVAGDEISVTVRDHGRWRKPRPGGGGRGLEIMRRFMDEVEIVRGKQGTEVLMRRKLGVRHKRLTTQ